MHQAFCKKKPADTTYIEDAAVKPRTYKCVSIRIKHNAIMDLQKGMKNNTVAAKYGILK